MDQNRYCESVGFCFLLIVAEIILRSVWTVRSCIKFECDFSRIAGLKVRNIDRATFIGFTRFDELLGYVPREGFSGVINAPGWVNGKVTIRSDGFGQMVLNRLCWQRTSWSWAIHLHLATRFLTMRPGQNVLKGNWGRLAPKLQATMFKTTVKQP